MTTPGPQPAQDSPSPYAAAIAAQLRRAPRQLSPSDAAAIGVLLGPITAQGQENAQGSAA